MQRSRNHVERGLEKLTEQFRNLPVMRAVLSAWLRRIQEFEDAIWIVDDLRLNPTGVFLDWWGAIVGRGRGDLSEADFWRFIRAQILANKAHGDFPTLLEILATASPDDTIHTLRNAFPAGLRLDTVGPYAARAMQDLLRTAIAAGVRLQMNVAPPAAVPTDRVFRTSPVYNTRTVDPLRGAGFVGDPTIGGLLAYVLLAE
jgi:hypothetical protein